ncbi:hypothetical protein BKA57DRAFT_190172 [Linnemannia elongata]|nr:hypothetical protein BKA57DRAFT_190172 [Linnemannia elongata]
MKRTSQVLRLDMGCGLIDTLEISSLFFFFSLCTLLRLSAHAQKSLACNPYFPRVVSFAREPLPIFSSLAASLFLSFFSRCILSLPSFLHLTSRPFLTHFSQAQLYLQHHPSFQLFFHRSSSPAITHCSPSGHSSTSGDSPSLHRSNIRTTQLAGLICFLCVKTCLVSLKSRLPH